MLITHPDLPGSLADVPDSVHRRVLAARGWVPAPDPVAGLADKTVTTVLDEVGSDPVKASLTLAQERAGRDRSSLTRALARIAEQDTEPDQPDAPPAADTQE